MKAARGVKRPMVGCGIGVFSPSEPITPSRQLRINEQDVSLNRYGHTLVFANNWLAHDAFQAGSPAQRVSDISWLLKNEKTDLLIASWGGKSCSHLLKSFDYSLAEKMEKPILAFSDGCTLLNAITTKSRIVTFYGPNVLGKLDESGFGDLRQFFSGEGFSDIDLKFPNEQAIVFGGKTATGVLVGGNLSSFAVSVLGSKYEPEFDELILFLESGGKTPQEFDFLVTSICNSRLMDRVKGIIFGDLPERTDERWGNDKSISDILEIHFSNLGIPVYLSPFFGHRNLPNPSIPIGALATLDTARGILQIESECLK